MTLVNPILLWALAGLAVPVVIHLLSRKEGKIIRLGSIRHVVETSTQQFKGIRLNEIILLLLRCAMIIVFCLLLSGLQCSGVQNQKWVVVESTLRDNFYVKSIIDSLVDQGYEPHLLTNDFPGLRSNDSVSKVNYWKLAEELRLKKLSEVIVFASNHLENFKGQRIELSGNIRWVTTPLPEKDFLLSSIRLGDSIVIRSGHTNGNEISFMNRIEPANSNSLLSSGPDTIQVLLVSDPDFNYDERMINAALKAIEESIPVKLSIEKSKTAGPFKRKYDWCFWLSSEKLPPTVSSKKVFIKPQNSNKLMIHQDSDKWIITHRLNEEIALREMLTLQLTQLITPQRHLEKIAETNSRLMMPDSLAWASFKTSSSKPEFASPSATADRLLILCLLILLVTERIIAYQRKQ